MSDLSKVNTDQVIWFLQEFENADDDQLEDGGCEIYGEDDKGNEGSFFLSTQQVCGRAAEEIQRLQAEVERLKGDEQDVKDLMACVTHLESITQAAKNRAKTAEQRVKELERERCESLRLFTNSLMRKFKDRDKILKSDIVKFSAKRIEQLRTEGGE